MTDIRLEGIEKTYRGHEAVRAVKGISLSVRSGEFVTLLGPSGCGKTTTLRAIAGLEKPDRGVIILGEDVVCDPEAGIDWPPERRKLGMVFQSYALWPHLSVEANVSFPLEMRGVPRQDRNARVEKVLQLVGLEALHKRYPGQLSGGQQQRVALARALVAEPQALLLDEPLSNLDAKLRERMRFELVDVQRKLGVTTVYVTHDQAEAMVMSDRIVVMNQGLIEQIATPMELYRHPANRFVADFLGAVNLVPGSVQSKFTDGEVRLCRFETKAGLLVAPDVEAHVGSRVWAVVRPENVKLNKPTAASSNTFTGRVSRRAYLGREFHYEVDVAGLDAPLKVISGTSEEFEIDSAVSVEIERDHIVLMGSEEAGPGGAQRLP